MTFEGLWLAYCGWGLQVQLSESYQVGLSIFFSKFTPLVMGQTMFEV